MAITALDINPVRFYSNLNTIDNSTYFPNDHNIVQRNNYFEGEYAQKFYPVHLINKAIYLQFQNDGGDLTLVVHKPDGTTSNITPVNINPTGWTGTDVWLYTYTPSVKGIYYFQFALGNMISDKYYVISETKFKKRLIKVEYYNSFNDFETVFFDGTTQVFAPVIYLEGILKAGTPRNEKSTFQTDRGELTINRATPIPTATLQLMTHRTLLAQLNIIFSCDRIVINGVSYQTSEPIEPENVEKEDMYKVNINLLETSYNFSRKVI